ncbi:hypothetical protein H9P43_004640 [Blastocladiella emersonii ATCC 22665]|nr:hypothetical protein H9P43_004640 [Blastocladiella emersonii ATCC 22665]
MTSIFSSTELPSEIGTIKMVIATASAVMCGLNHVEGANGIMGFLLTANVAGLTVAKRVGLDEEAIGGKLPIVMEAALPSMAWFVLLWTLFAQLY